MRGLGRHAIVLGVVGVLAGSCTAATVSTRPRRHFLATTTTTPARPAASHFSHVFVVVMENESYGDALGVPEYAAIGHRYAYASRSYAASHPSLPNYLALTAGSTFGISSDCLTCYVESDNLAGQLSAAHVSWDAFFQSVSAPCYLGTSYGLYAAKHNPFRYYKSVRSSHRICSHLLPFADFDAMLARRPSAVPSFAWVTPNVCDDGHSCPQSVAAPWLASFVRRVTASSAWRDGGLLLVTWDEGAFGDVTSVSPSGRLSPSGGGGHVLTLIVSPDFRPGIVIRLPLSPYAILATVEENFRLPLLREARKWRADVLTPATTGRT